jgi:hypothetical protein
MSHYSIQLAKQELLHHMLQVGGSAVVHLHSLEQVIEAHFTVELTDSQAITKVKLGEHQAELKLRITDRANHLHLRDFIEDMANGRHESAAPRPAPACAETPEPTLSQNDQRALDRVSKEGGTCTLESGAVLAVHASPHQSSRTAIAVIGDSTHMVSGSFSSVYMMLVDHITQQQAA